MMSLTTIAIRIDTRIKLVGNVGVMRAVVGGLGGGGGESASCTVGVGATGQAATLGAVVAVGVDARVELVGDVGIMRARGRS